MSTLNNLERIPVPDYATFEKKYIQNRKPVILRGVFAGQAIEKVDTPTRARRAFRQTPVCTVREYYKDFVQTGSMFAMKRRASTLSSYLDLIQRYPDSPMVITEQVTPPQVAEMFSVPTICQYLYGADETEGILSEMFVAGQGNVAHLHFDWDHRHVLLYQVFGRKRICLIAPERSAFLNPVLNMSLANIECMTEDERVSFIKYLSGYDAVLYPGDAVYIPPLMWHYLEYLDLAMSLGLRFGRSRHGRICQERFHPNMHLQNFAWKAFREEKLVGLAAKLYRKIIAAYTTAPRGGFFLYRRMQRVFEGVYAEFCQDSAQGEVWHPIRDFVERQVRIAIAKNILYPRHVSRK
jgi:hypothetical protein